MRIQPKNTGLLIDAALGSIPCALGIFNAQIVNTITGEIYRGDVYVHDGFIVHVEIYADDIPRRASVHSAIEADGAYLLPGLIDAHIHIESTMMTPYNFGSVSLPCGTTTVVTDPHEIANVFGVRGVEYMIAASRLTPQRQIVLAPSCVPSVLGCEDSGASFDVRTIERLLGYEEIIGLGEIMDFVGVCEKDARMMDIIAAGTRAGAFLQGHAPMLSGRMLSAYALTGIRSCHESRSGAEALGKLRAGMFVDARESSVSKNVADIYNGVKHCKNLSHLTLCTDDREVGDILEYGHMNDVVRHAVRASDPIVAAITQASYNVACELGITNLGAIAIGFVADMLLVPSLDELVPSCVFCSGVLVARDGEMVEEFALKPGQEFLSDFRFKNDLETTKDVEFKQAFEVEKINSIVVSDFTEEMLEIVPPKGAKSVIVNTISYISSQKSLTNLKKVELNIEDNRLVLGDNLAKVAIINRYAGNDSYALGIVDNFGLKYGALASSISHDSHNVSIVYHSNSDALLALNWLRRLGGGIVLANKGKIVASLNLEIAGLISARPPKDLAKEIAVMKGALREAGIEMSNPLLRISTLALPVIPEVKMSNKGLVDVLRREIIGLFEE